jgi:broad specificity phosphatase PhoE
VKNRASYKNFRSRYPYMAINNNHILEKVEWGKPVLRLLEQSKNLNKKAPATLIIRHSERNKIEKASEMEHAGLTGRGRDAAYNFGQILPLNWEIRLFHSPVNRCRDTATRIHEGAVSAGVKSEIAGGLNILWGANADKEKWTQLMLRDWPQSYSHWMSGRYSPSIVEPSIDYAKRLAEEFDKNSVLDRLTIYVAHDTQILTLLFHWFGVSPRMEYASFLNGFFAQRVNSRLVLLSGDSNIVCEAPYWWR